MQFADLEEFPVLNTIPFCFEYDHVYVIPWYLVRTLEKKHSSLWSIVFI